MPRFFVESVPGDTFLLTGEDGRHLVKSLRMRPGEAVTLCDGQGSDYRCVILETGDASATLQVVEREENRSEPDILVTLYQGIPKSDKMDLIIQKAVELGCSRIVPTRTAFCVSDIRGKEEKKRERWQKIALEAAKQSGRGIVPQVLSPLSFREALAAAGGTKILCYEGGGAPMGQLIGAGTEREFSLFIGPEGGLSREELALALESGAKAATLGPRILRTETAPLAALTLLFYLTGNMN
jgi:16S rRNA (uracil1498-N3)-methyltransferase